MIDHKRKEPQWDKIQDHAIKQGFIIVGETKRICLVIRLDNCGNGMWSNLINPNGYRYTNMGGSIVFRGTWEKCRDYIATHGQPIPSEFYAE